ncbi:MAG: tryptophan synthase subunit alpha, partial [Lysobacteraceae bacterium]
ADEYRAAFAHRALALISLASPTTPEARLQRLATQADGYLYYVSFAGVTGADRLDIGDAGQRLQHLRAMAAIPVYAGFGIRDAQSAAAMGEHADGVVVGSALVSALEGSKDEAEAAVRAADFLRPLRHALDRLAIAA